MQLTSEQQVLLKELASLKRIERRFYQTAGNGPAAHVALRIAEGIEAALRAVAKPMPTHRHRKRGHDYIKVARGHLQTDVPISDYAELVAYVDHASGDWWFRPPGEFDDKARFDTLSIEGTPAEAANLAVRWAYNNAPDVFATTDIPDPLREAIVAFFRAVSKGNIARPMSIEGYATSLIQYLEAER